MKRPLGVAILAGFILLNGLLGLAFLSVITWQKGFQLEPLDVGSAWWWWGVVLAMARFTLSGIYMAVGLGLWRLRKWARDAFILLMALGIAGVIASLLIRLFVPDVWSPALWFVLLLLAWQSLCVAYMYSRSVKQAFAIP